MKYIIGIDEVGRGPIAGPVAVGAFVFLKPEAYRHFAGVKESKQLTEKKREEWFNKIEEIRNKGLKNIEDRIIDFAVVFQSEKVIDEKGISFAIKTALNRALEKLNIDKDSARILLDGGLHAPIEYRDQETIIKGDEKEDIIALASICAKVLRDRKMREYGEQYMEYGFESHKGYGTKAHYEAIHRKGLTDIHRLTFIKGIDKGIGKDIAKNANIR
jgi:ribonuclease HII